MTRALIGTDRLQLDVAKSSEMPVR